MLRGGLPERHQGPRAEAGPRFQRQFGSLFDCGQMFTVHGGEGGMGPHLGSDPRGRGAAPESSASTSRSVAAAGSPAAAGRLLRPSAQVTEAEQVGAVGGHFQAIAARVPY